MTTPPLISTCICQRPMMGGKCAHCDEPPGSSPSACTGVGCGDCWERDRRCVVCRSAHPTRPSALRCEKLCRGKEIRSAKKVK